MSDDEPPTLTLVEGTSTALERCTEMQRRFVEAFTGEAAGNATEAVKLAKLHGPDDSASAIRQRGHRFKTTPTVQAAIVESFEAIRSAAVMDRFERQSTLTTIARNTGALDADRIRAIMVLGKMQGDFVERHDVRVSQVAEVRFVLPSNGRGPAPPGGVIENDE